MANYPLQTSRNQYPSNPKKLNSIVLAHEAMHAMGDKDHEDNDGSVMYSPLLDSWVSIPGNEPHLTAQTVQSVLKNLNLDY